MSKPINILIAPDKMKGTLSAKEICEIIESVALENNYVDSIGDSVKFNCTSLPLADGGDGSLSVLKNVLQLQKVNLKVKGPLLEPIRSHYAVDNKGNAYVEMAAAAGLVQVSPEKRNCMHTTSYGFGELINHAISSGIKKVYLFLGGSATCDAGIGMATALGYKFLDKEGKQIQPFGGQLNRVTKIELPQNLEVIKQTSFITLYDVNNTILGSQGAAPAFAPQKGANIQEVRILENGLTNIVELLKTNNDSFENIRPAKDDFQNLEQIRGGGAAGGMGLGTYAFLGAQLSPGTEEIMRLTKFSERIKNQNIIITAEGQIDKSTLNGKVPFGVALEAKNRGIPCYVIGGSVKLMEMQKDQLDVIKWYSLSDSVGKVKSLSNPKGALSKVAKIMLEDIALHHSKI
ncbi:glycerate kinase [Winogradskyella sp.]|uniref:glycerate kinase family protein n=1 Tax=Winogradskyella sp. TaxID=1883156 RepID=UPI0026103D43|nr:glycerate kinase [Winogradskyella sp.]